jgi:hypothetical protein
MKRARRIPMAESPNRCGFPRRALSARLALFGGALLLATNAGAQTPPTISSVDATTPGLLAPGAPAGSYALTGFDRVNLSTLHLSVAVPLLDVPGRGDAKATMMLPFDRVWNVKATPAPYNCGANGCSYNYNYVPTPNEWNP